MKSECWTAVRGASGRDFSIGGIWKLRRVWLLPYLFVTAKTLEDLSTDNRAKCDR